MRYICLAIFLILINCKSKDDCKEKINHLPMFGRIKKCSDQIKADNEFLTYCDKEFKNRNEAAKNYISRAWDYFYNKQYDTAMFRFNQAWLLDSLNAEVYWGFGNLLGVDHRYKESISFFDRSLRLDPNNPKVWECAATSYGQYFFETKDGQLLKTTIEYLKKSLSLDSNNTRIYGQLAAAYSYYIQKDSAKRYLEISDKFNPNLVDKEVRKMIEKK